MTNRKTTDDFDPQTLKLFDLYVHGDINRREFLSKVAKVAAGSASGLALLNALKPNFALGQQVKPDHADINARFVNFDSPQGYGKVRAYLVTPKASLGPRPTVLVVHENRGLNPHIEDVARRFALAGFIALAPDALFPLGGYPGDEDQARALFSNLDQGKTKQDFIQSSQYLRTLTAGNGKVGVVGFCYGGGMANYLASELPWLNAAVPFYGKQAELEKVPSIQAPLLIHYAADDERINAGADAYTNALKAAGKSVQSFVYPNTVHGFHNDTTPRFNKEAATLAWQRTVDFFNVHLAT